MGSNHDTAYTLCMLAQSHVQSAMFLWLIVLRIAFLLGLALLLLVAIFINDTVPTGDSGGAVFKEYENRMIQVGNYSLIYSEQDH